MKALITANLDEENLRRLREDLGLEVEYDPIADREGPYSPEQLGSRLEGVEILVVLLEKVDGRVLEAASDLRILACTRGGPGANVDIPLATERGIPVLYAPGRNAVSVADHTLGLLLAVARNIARSHHLLREGQFTGRPADAESTGGERRDVVWGAGKDSPYVRLKGPELPGKTIGIVGLGAIGRAVAKRARGFEMNLIGTDPQVDAETFRSLGVEMVDLHPLCRRSDFITLHVPVTEETRGMIGKEELEMMKPSATFINTARGALVDEDELVRTLKRGGLRAAALDVFESEPLPEDHPLLSMDHVVTTPHIGGAAEEVIQRHSSLIVNDIERILAGKKPVHIANPPALESAGF